ncbi:MAG: chlorite dismutase family protein, partial [Spartobacteria bacterium]
MQTPPEILPTEGRHVLHLFFRVEYSAWELLNKSARIAAKTALAELVREIRATPGTQLLLFSMVTPKADLGFMLLTPDLQNADAFAKRLATSLGPDILTPTFSWLSMTERSEYTTSDAEYAATLEAEEKLTPGTPAFDEKMQAFSARMAKYLKDRLEPNLPDWPVVCLYPMSKRRSPGQNWYALDFDARKKLMAGHARVGRTYSGRILQLITGSTGLDDEEWFVTLFAKTTSDIKAIVYEMRFDEVS